MGQYGPRSHGKDGTRLERRFPLGDSIRSKFEANRDSYVTLIDVGTSGRVSVVWPNAWQRTVKGFITFTASKLLFLRLAFSAAKLMKPLTVTEAAPISSRVNLWSL